MSNLQIISRRHCTHIYHYYFSVMHWNALYIHSYLLNKIVIISKCLDFFSNIYAGPLYKCCPFETLLLDQSENVTLAPLDTHEQVGLVAI